MKKNNKIIKILLICFLILVIIALIYFLFLRKPSTEEVKDSVVMLEIYDEDGTLISTGSGFCAYKSNYIVTNYHVIEGARTIKIIDDDKKEYNTNKIEIMNKNTDLAILSGNFSFKPLKTNVSQLSAGEEIMCIGSPQGELNTVSSGIISNADDEYEIRITAPISPGSSGGVLLDKNNNVIGVVYASYNSALAQNINYAINIYYLEEMNYELCLGEYKSLEEREDSEIKKYDLIDLNYNLNKKSTEDIKFRFGSYYCVNNLEKFYNMTSNRKKFEKIVKLMDYDYKRKIKFDYDTRTINYLVKSGLKVDNAITFLENLPEHEKEDKYSFEYIANHLAITRYQYAILIEKISDFSTADEIITEIDLLPINDVQKNLLKYCLVYKDISYFNNDENKELIDFILEHGKVVDDKYAISILQKMGYIIVETGDNSYKFYWN